MTNQHRFIKATIHTGDQPDPPLPYVGERSYSVKMSSGTSKFIVGNAQKQNAYNLGKDIINPIGVTDRLTPSGWTTNAMLSYLNQGINWIDVVKIKGTLTLIIGVDRGPFVSLSLCFYIYIIKNGGIQRALLQGFYCISTSRTNPRPLMDSPSHG